MKNKSKSELKQVYKNLESEILTRLKAKFKEMGTTYIPIDLNDKELLVLIDNNMGFIDNEGAFCSILSESLNSLIDLI